MHADCTSARRNDYTTSTSNQTFCCSEMAPPHLRGRFNQLYQIVLTFFILVAQVINLIINLTDAVSWGWRLSLGFAFVPSLILFLGGVFLPDSPNSLLERGHLEQVSPATQTWHVLRTFVASVFNQSTPRSKTLRSRLKLQDMAMLSYVILQLVIQPCRHAHDQGRQFWGNKTCIACM